MIAEWIENDSGQSDCHEGDDEVKNAEKSRAGLRMSKKSSTFAPDFILRYYAHAYIHSVRNAPVLPFGGTGRGQYTARFSIQKSVFRYPIGRYADDELIGDGYADDGFIDDGYADDGFGEGGAEEEE